MAYPDNLRYTAEHEWARLEDGTVTVGITSYATEQLGDVVFVELPDALETRQAPDVEDAWDVRVRQPRADLRLREEATRGLGTCGPKHFYRPAVSDAGWVPRGADPAFLFGKGARA